MLKQLLVCLIAIQQHTAQICVKGCLSCNTSNECLLCDLTSNYFQKSSSDNCQLGQIEQCIKYLSDGNCQTCSSTTYINSQKCVAVETDIRAANPNCQIWDAQQNCTACKPNYLLNQGQCELITSIIPNCDSYESQTKCSLCADGYRIDANLCVALPTSIYPKCQYFGDFECEVCDVTHIINPNLYMNMYKLESGLVDLYKTSQDFRVSLQNTIVCQEIADLNCLINQTYDKCITCKEGFYLLQDGTCHKNPENIVPHCVIYTSNTKCSLCETDYYVTNSDKCQAVTDWTECQTFFTNKDECERCNDGFKLTTESRNCIERGQTVDNCALHDASNDTCIQCEPNYELQTQKCIGYNQNDTQVQPCKQGAYGSITDQSVEYVSCTDCDPGFYLGNGSLTGQLHCLLGDVSLNCQIFVMNANTDGSKCDLCKEGYYNDNFICKPHPEEKQVNNCQHHSNVTEGVCEICVAGFIASKIKSICEFKVAEITNCSSYDDSGICEACDDSHILKGENCEDAQNNCKLSEANSDINQCLQCDLGYGLRREIQSAVPLDHTCELAGSSLSQYCFNDFTFEEGLQWNQLTCKSCQIDAHPMDLKYHSVCVQKEALLSMADFTTEILDVVNCAVFSEANGGNNPECIQCKSNYALDIVNQTCNALDQCSGTIALLQKKSYFTQNLVCNSAVGNTKYTSMSYDNRATQISLECKDEYLPLYVNTKLYTNVSFNQSNTNMIQVDSFATMYTEVDCSVTKASATNLADIQNCKRYAFFEGSLYKCIRCENGFTFKGADFDCDEPIDECLTSEAKNVPIEWQKSANCLECNNTGAVTDVLIPYVFMDTSKTALKDQYVPFDVTQSLWQTSATPSFYNGCVTFTLDSMYDKFKIDNGHLSITQNEIDYEEVNSKGQIPDFCGLIVVQLQNKIDASNHPIQRTIQCGYCRKGYYPKSEIVDGIDYPFVTQCQVVENCQIPMINGCEQCAPGYAFEMRDDGVINTASCIQILDNGVIEDAPENCLVLFDNKCVICQKNYSIDKDDNCEQRHPLNCNESFWTLDNPYLNYHVETDDSSIHFKSTQNNIQMKNYLTPQIGGCQQCTASSDVGILLGGQASSETIMQSLFCLKRKTPLLNTFLNANSNYIENCKRYQSQELSQQKCAECDENYILTKNDKCKSKDAIEGCELYSDYDVNDSSMSCSRCKQTETEKYALIKVTDRHICQLLQDIDCQDSNVERQNYATAQCLVCKAGHYLDSNGVCQDGYVQHCLHHTDQFPNQCQECQPGYVLITDLQNTIENIHITSTDVKRHYCIQMPDVEITNCSKMTSQVSSDGVLEFYCDTCRYLNYKVIDTTASQVASIKESYCASHNTINNCVDFLVDDPVYNGNYQVDNVQKITESNFSCIKCTENTHYVDINIGNKKLGYSCVIRTQTYQLDQKQCTSFDYFTDKCTSCATDYFLNDTGNECVIFPSGITGCVAWQSAAEGPSPVCSACQENEYYLLAGVCIKVDINNCDKVANNSCEICKKTYYLQNGNDIDDSPLTNQCKQGSVSNCTLLTSETSCQICDDGYKRELDSNSNNVCNEVTITDCQTYLGDQCVECGPNTYLSINSSGNSCNDPSTSIAECQKYDSATTCEICNPPYALSSTKTSCIATNTFIGWDQKCVQQAERDTKVCSQCKPGYHFDGGSCSPLTGDQSLASGCFLPDLGNEDGKCLICNRTHYMNSLQKCVKNTSVDDPDGTGADIRSIMAVLMAFLVLF